MPWAPADQAQGASCRVGAVRPVSGALSPKSICNFSPSSHSMLQTRFGALSLAA